MNNHRFDLRFVREVFRAVSAAGVDYVELGYRNSRKHFPPDEFGIWKYSSDEDISNAVDGIESGTKISVMADVGRCRIEEIKPAAESPVDMIRVASYVKNIGEAIALANTFADMGYETTLNIMAISRDGGPELTEALRRIREESRALVIYIVDSFGSIHQRDVENLVTRFRDILENRKIGFHGHNNLQLAFGNTIEAVLRGVDFVDGTVHGIGRAAGNCPLELLLGFLKKPGSDLKPILELISREFVPLKEKLEWGYVIPYALTGMANEHPRSAMELRKSSRKDDYAEFFKSLGKRDRT
jgi:4-hydroxy 2-oxovalerate aldolase